MLSKKLSKSAGDSDIQSLVSAVALGVFAGTSGKNHGTYGTYGAYGTNSHRDTYSANTAYDIQPTSYGQPTSYRQYYHPYGPTKPPTPDFGETLPSALKEVLGSFLKFSTGSSFSSANLSGTSSSSNTGLSASLSYSAEKEEKPTYSALTRSSYYALPPQSTRPADSPPGPTGQSWEVTRYSLLIVTLFSIAIVTFFCL